MQKRSMGWPPPVHTRTRDWTCLVGEQTRNLDTCSDQESNLQPFLVTGPDSQITLARNNLSFKDKKMV